MRRPPETIAAVLSQNVRTLRDAKKLTQEDLAKKAKLPRSTICNIEGQQYGMPRSTVLESVADALGVTVGALLTGRPPAKPRSTPKPAHS